eukprot:scaffold222_cov336-Prasinococcus_capsulatus_cf.AAC.1
MGRKVQASRSRDRSPGSSDFPTRPLTRAPAFVASPHRPKRGRFGVLPAKAREDPIRGKMRSSGALLGPFWGAWRGSMHGAKAPQAAVARTDHSGPWGDAR